MIRFCQIRTASWLFILENFLITAFTVACDIVFLLWCFEQLYANIMHIHILIIWSILALIGQCLLFIMSWIIKCNQYTICTDVQSIDMTVVISAKEVIFLPVSVRPSCCPWTGLCKLFKLFSWNLYRIMDYCCGTNPFNFGIDLIQSSRLAVILDFYYIHKFILYWLWIICNMTTPPRECW